MAGAAGWFNQGMKILLSSALADDDAQMGDNFYFTLVSDGTIDVTKSTLDELEEVTLQDQEFSRSPIPRSNPYRVIIWKTAVVPADFMIRFNAIGWVVHDEGFDASHMVLVDQDSDDANLLAWWTLGDFVPMTFYGGSSIYIPYAEARWNG